MQQTQISCLCRIQQPTYYIPNARFITLRAMRFLILTFWKNQSAFYKILLKRLVCSNMRLSYFFALFATLPENNEEALLIVRSIAKSELQRCVLQ